MIVGDVHRRFGMAALSAACGDDETDGPGEIQREIQMLLAALPFGAYTQPDGKCNLATYAPEGACAPELQVRVRRVDGQSRAIEYD